MFFGTGSTASITPDIIGSSIHTISIFSLLGLTIVEHTSIIENMLQFAVGYFYCLCVFCSFSGGITVLALDIVSRICETGCATCQDCRWLGIKDMVRKSLNGYSLCVLCTLCGSSTVVALNIVACFCSTCCIACQLVRRLLVEAVRLQLAYADGILICLCLRSLFTVVTLDVVLLQHCTCGSGLHHTGILSREAVGCPLTHALGSVVCRITLRFADSTHIPVNSRCLTGCRLLNTAILIISVVIFMTVSRNNPGVLFDLLSLHIEELLTHGALLVGSVTGIGTSCSLISDLGQAMCFQIASGNSVFLADNLTGLRIPALNVVNRLLSTGSRGLFAAGLRAIRVVMCPTAGDEPFAIGAGAYVLKVSSVFVESRIDAGTVAVLQQDGLDFNL